MALAVNKCGGRRWETHRNWAVEVEGEGFPLVEPTDARFKNMTQTWEHWGPLFKAASKRYGIPTSWLLALASIETGFLSANPAKQAGAVSPAGAVGLMQIMPFVATGYGYRAEDRTNPEVSIDISAHLISDLARGRTGPELPVIGSAYNAGAGSTSLGVRCSTGRNEWNFAADHNYPRQAIEYNNSAIHYLDVNKKTSVVTMALGGAVCFLGLGYLAERYIPALRRRG